ncbi:MAG: Gfo/Idh/MocA family oxidoreductase [Bacteroidales bacterium]|jgi:predicted dehydrogenase|nr:Gfo/Idh/MocA family oxidoreductase [Bacteroidales bacterium]
MSTRREFLRQAVVASAALTFGGMMNSIASDRRKSVIGANDTIHLAVIGVNSRGKALAKNFSKMPQCEVTHLCDCDSNALASCQSEVAKITGKAPKGISDIRKLLEIKDIDAVVIAMPDHWHAPAAIMAMNAGKHVYLEKPTSHNPAENQMLLKVASKHPELVITVGNQRRSWPRIREAIEELNNGAIGDVHFAKSWYMNNRPSIGKGKIVPVPANLNWDLWQGPAPRIKEFKDNIVHYNWHWFWRWGTGEALNNGTHFVDLIRWGLQVGYPTEVSSVGGRWRFQDDWQVPDTQLISFQFGNKAAGSWEGRSCNNVPADNYACGVAFFGSEGALYLNGGNEYKIVDINGKTLKEVKSDVSFKTGDLQNPSEQLDAFHFKNWFDAIKKGTPLNSTLEEACKSTQLVQLGNIAQRVGHSLQINPDTGFIIGDPEAQQLWGRDYEPGWEPIV